MDIGKPLAEYGRVDITTLREKMLCLPKEFWDIDRTSRIKLAGNRPGNAVFFYNDSPACLPRQAMHEFQSGVVSVLRYEGRLLITTQN